MTDRELLEMAARAAGVVGRFIESRPEDGAPRYSCGIGNAGHITKPWNPLINDGDALRLLNACQLNVFHTGGRSYAMQSDDDGSGEVAVSYSDAGGKDDATRRAIVRAAAAIGEGME